MKDIKKLALEIHQGNVKRGFYEVQPTLKTQLALASSELFEAIEADRKNNYVHGLFIGVEMTPKAFEESIKDTFQDEIADTFIRLLDIVGNYDLDIYEWRWFEGYKDSVYSRIDMNQSKCEILFDLQKMIYDCTESNTIDYEISIGSRQPASAVMKWLTVEPVPTPTVMPSRKKAVAASAARCFLVSAVMSVFPGDFRMPDTTVPACAGTV